MEDIQEKAMQDELNPEQERLEEQEALERHLKHIRERVRKAETDENYNRKETLDLLNACLDRDGTIVFIVVK